MHTNKPITSKFKGATKYLTLPLIASVVVACGGGSGGGTGGNTGLQMTLTAPLAYPAGSPSAMTANLTLTNTSNESAIDLDYVISSNTTGINNITVPNDFPENPCKNVNAKSSCTFPVMIAPNANPGSFGVTISTGNSSLLNSTKSLVGLKSSDSITLKANVGLTNIAPNNSPGADGISFLYSPIVSRNPNGATVVSIVAVVGTNAGGSFDDIRLTDANGNPLNYRVLSGNTGAHLTNLVSGSLVQLELTIPAGSPGSFPFHATVYEDNNKVGETSKKAETITLVSSGTGILSLNPTNANFTHSESNVTLTYTNIGTGNISGLTVGDIEAPIVDISNGCGSTLAPNASCTVQLHSTAGLGVSGTGSITTNYTTGSTTTPLIMNYNYAGEHPESGFSLSAVNNFVFTSNTVNLKASTEVTLTNTSNTSESDFTFNFQKPEYFTISTGSGSGACTVVDNKIMDTLQKNQSCNFKLEYDPGNNLASGSDNMTIDYKYHGDRSGTASHALGYDTTQATASLTISPTPQSFGTIVANGIDSKTNTLTLTNAGPDSATDISKVVSVGSNFTIVPASTNPCGSTLAANTTCNIGIKYGPSSTVSSNDTATLTISYNSSTSPEGTNPLSTSASLSGTAREINSANPQITEVALSGSKGGTGITENTKFQVEGSGLTLSAQAYELTLTYKNLSTTADANNFIVSGAPSYYTLSQNNCNNFTLEKAEGNSCTVVYTLNSLTTGAKNFEIPTVKGSWSTDDQGQLTNQTMLWDTNLETGDNSMVYISVYTPASVSAILSGTNNGVTPITEVNPESDFYVVFTLSGGYQVNTTYTATAPNDFTTTSNTCQVLSNTPTCSVKFKAPDDSIESANITLAGTPIPTSNPNPLMIKVNKPNKWVFVSQSSPDAKMAVGGTYQQWQNIQGGVAGADEICNHDAQSTGWIGTNAAIASGLTWKAMIVDGESRIAVPARQKDWVLQKNTLYIDIKTNTKNFKTDTDSLWKFPMINSFGYNYQTWLTQYTANTYLWQVYTLWTGVSATGNTMSTCERWNNTEAVPVPRSWMAARGFNSSSIGTWPIDSSGTTSAGQQWSPQCSQSAGSEVDGNPGTRWNVTAIVCVSQ